MGGGQVRATVLGFLLLCPFLPPSNQLPLHAHCGVPPSPLHARTHTHAIQPLPLCICPSPAQTIGDPFSCEEHWGPVLGNMG